MRYTLLLLLISLTLSGQTEYNFSVHEGLYEPLTTGDTLSGGQPWSTEDFLFHTPFDVNIFGIYGRTIRAMQGAMRIDTTIEGDAMNVVASGYAMEIRSKASNPELSPIIMDISGQPGERVMTLEFRNAHFECLDGEGDYINFQLKYFELDRSIEFHYGDSETDRIKTMSDEKNIIFGALVGLALGDSLDLIDAYLLDGFADNPMLVRRNEILQGFPSSDQIFRFAPSTTSTHEQSPGCDALINWKMGNTAESLSDCGMISVYEINGRHLVYGTELSMGFLQGQFNHLSWLRLTRSI